MIGTRPPEHIAIAAIGLLAVALLWPQGATAAVITLNATSSGYYEKMRSDDSSTGIVSYSYSQVIGSYETAFSLYPGPNEIRIDRSSYFVFDLSSVSGTIQSAALNLTRGTVRGNPLTVGLYDVVSPTSDVIAGGPTTLANIFDDLSAGTIYGSLPLDDGGGGPFTLVPSFVHSVTLNTSAIAALNTAAGGMFAMGGSFLIASGCEAPNSSDTECWAFRGTDGTSTRQLVLTVADPGSTDVLPDGTAIPEPGTLLLFGLGLAGIGIARRQGADRRPL